MDLVSKTVQCVVPTKDAATVTEGGKPAHEAAGVRFLRTESQAVVYEVGSGTYVFVSPWGASDDAVAHVPPHAYSDGRPSAR